MGIDIRLMAYDYTAGEHKDVALDPATKAILVKDISPGVTDHGELTGLGDDDHTQYLHLNKVGQTLQQSLAVAAGKTVDGVDISAHAANASAHHAKTSKLSEITNIDADKDWNAKNITNMGTVEHRGSTLKSGIQTEGRASCREHHNAGDGWQNAHMNISFREKMTNTPSSITLSNAAETEESNMAGGHPCVFRITVYGFLFQIQAAADGTYYSFSKKYLTVGN